MSLPSRLIFIKDDEIVDNVFINIGWSFSPKILIIHLKREFEEILRNNDYDYFCAYDYKITKPQIIGMLDHFENIFQATDESFSGWFEKCIDKLDKEEYIDITIKLKD